MAAYTGETQRLEPLNDFTLQSRLLNIQTSHSIRYQTWAFDAARRYLASARRLLEEYRQYQDIAAQYSDIQLPPEIAAIIQEAQR